ncbi:MAG: helix-turn-helix domain-containing protein [Opitutaceae bacterium]|jgi:HTH-type transcriptional regulator/antitoxin HigA
MKTAKLPTRYAELVALHMPRPIRESVAYDNTVDVIDALAGHKLNADQEDYLELLSHLVETYEAAYLTPYPKVKGIEALKFILSENELTGDDLAKLLSVDRSTAYKILKGTRNLTTDHIRTLCSRFSVGAELLIA